MALWLAVRQLTDWQTSALSAVCFAFGDAEDFLEGGDSLQRLEDAVVVKR